MEFPLYDMLYSGLRTLFLFAAPLIVAASIAGLVAGAFQSVTSIQDSAALYAVKLLTVIVVLYVTLPPFINSLMELARMAFSGQGI